MERFFANIETRNAAMGTADAVAEAVRTMAEKVAAGYTEGVVMDENGNTVGHFEVTYPEGGNDE